MGFVVAIAEFPGASIKQRNQIYEALKKANWIQVLAFGHDLSSVWYGDWGITAENTALSKSLAEFTTCADPHCKPKLVLHFGPNPPASFGLT